MTEQSLNLYLKELDKKQEIALTKMRKATSVEERLMYKDIIAGYGRMGVAASRIYERQINPPQPFLRFIWS